MRILITIEGELLLMKNNLVRERIILFPNKFNEREEGGNHFPCICFTRPLFSGKEKKSLDAICSGAR